MYSIKNKLKIWLLSLFVLPFLVGWVSYGASDLLHQIMKPSIDKDLTIDIWENRDTVWKRFFKESTRFGIDRDGIPAWKTPSIIVKVTRLLLIIVIALSVTMILYNGMKYIIDTWNGKEWKSLIKNVVYIVIGILIALFSVVIITLIQSVPTTLDKETNRNSNNDIDNKFVEQNEYIVER